MEKVNGIKGYRWRYKPGQNEVFPISRSKFGEYLKCKSCGSYSTKIIKEDRTFWTYCYKCNANHHALT